jgi:hypothetical protein
MASVPARAVVIGMFVLGCGGGGGGDDAPDADPGPGDPDFRTLQNQVAILETRFADNDYGQVWAAFASEVDTGNYTEAMRVGNCRLLTSTAEYCQTIPCTGWCIDEVCHEYPTYRDAGRITMAGLTESISMTYQSGYYQPDNFPVPTDLFRAGDPITATGAGAAFPAFSVQATGVETLAPDLTGACSNEWHIDRGQDAVLSWDSPVVGSRVRAWMPSRNNGHGLPSQAVVECEGPDTGAFTIPSAMIDAMPDFLETDGCEGVGCVGIDCPPSTLERYATGRATAGSEEVVLRLSSQTTFYVYDTN